MPCYPGFPFVAVFLIIITELDILLGFLASEFPGISWPLLCVGRPLYHVVLYSGYRHEMRRKENGQKPAEQRIDWRTVIHSAPEKWKTSQSCFSLSLTWFFVPFSGLLLQQFRARGRGWGRGTYSGNNSSSSNDFQKRNREEEWDPEYTPKSKKYYLVRAWG